jgi:hypothetical protein
MTKVKTTTWNEFDIRDFSEGMVEGIDDNSLPLNAARDCRNFISKYKGILEKRTGQSRFNMTELSGPPHGIYAYYNGSARNLLVMAGTNLLVWNPTQSTFDTLKSGLNGSARMFFETCVNYMVAMNGVNSPIKWNGSGNTSVLAQAPVGKYPTLHMEKLFCVPSSDTSQLWWSDSFAPETWPAVNYWDIKKGDGDEITCLKVFLGDLVIFKNRSSHLLRGSSLDNFRLDEIDTRIGCVGHDAAVTLGMRLFFVSSDGIYIFNGVTVNPISDERIPRLWKDIDQGHISNSSVTSWDNKVWVSLPLKNKITLKVTAACVKDGEIKILLGGIGKGVTLESGDSVNEIAAKIAALTFEGWTITADTDTVTFLRNELRQPLSLDLSIGETGIAADINTVSQTTNNLVIIIDPDKGYKFWPMDNINANCFAVYNDGSDVMLLSGDSISGYINQQDVGTEDFGQPVSAYWIGRAFDGGGIPEHLKKGKKAFIEDYPYQVTPATLKLSCDYGEFHEWTYRKNDGLTREYRVPSEYKVKWRYIIPRLSHSSAGKCEIRGLMIPFKPKRRPKGRNDVKYVG